MIALLNPLSVDEQPSVTMRDWRLMQLACGSRHLIGVLEETNKLRVSSAIKIFDRATMTVTTRSGRVYQLAGEPTPENDLWSAAWFAWAIGHRQGREGHCDITASVTHLLH